MAHISKPIDAPSRAPKVAIGPAKAHELAAVLSLLERSGLVAEGLPQHLPTLLVARYQGRVVGSAAVELYGSYALLRSVAVEEALRGQGLGTRLTRAALELARRRGTTNVYLLTDSAAGFYPRFGFRPIPRHQVPPPVKCSVEFDHACPVTAQAMVAVLAPAEDKAPASRTG